jgi:hypothetical protein
LDVDVDDMDDDDDDDDDMDVEGPVMDGYGRVRERADVLLNESQWA